MMYDPSLLGDDQFLQGVTRYDDHYADSEENRIVLLLHFADDLADYAIVDTGAPWSILHPEIAAALDLIPDNAAQSHKLNIRGHIVSGWLERTPVSLKSLQGLDLTLEAIFFIPDVNPEAWRFPNFIGYNGFLNIIRFAVDPAHNHFYFGV